MIDSFFRALAYIFHPLLMPVMGLFFILELPTIPKTLHVYDSLFFFPDEAKYRLYIVIGVLTFAAPVLSVFIMYWNRMISDLSLENRKERTGPYFMVIFYYLLAYIFVRYQWPEQLAHSALLGFLFGMVLCNLISFVINFWVKISAHAAGMFGVFALVLAYNQSQLAFYKEENIPNLGFTLFLLVVAGIVVTGRLYTRAHSLREVLLGMLVGFSSIYLCVKFGIYI